jgi:predicted nucleotidyltransferase component of viral defense system
VRKEVDIEKSIAYSKYANTQVFLNTVSLKDMMISKVESFNRRKEIRDIFDIEFLLKKGIELPDDNDALKRMVNLIDSLTERDYKVKLGSLLDEEQRKYYIYENFKILKLAIREKVGK